MGGWAGAQERGARCRRHSPSKRSAGMRTEPRAGGRLGAEGSYVTTPKTWLPSLRPAKRWSKARVLTSALCNAVAGFGSVLYDDCCRNHKPFQSTSDQNQLATPASNTIRPKIQLLALPDRQLLRED
eukprot:919056-Rhodomonas_salina.2